MMTAEQLKNSILQLALQGRLVEQSTEDESAQKLLERIRTAKRALIKAGTVPKDKKMEEVSEDDQLFDLPENWIWTRMGELFQHNTGKALNGTNKDGEVLTYITTSNLYWNRFELDNLKSMPFTESEVEKCTVTKGDLLVCEGGDYGRAAIWNYDFDMRIQNHVHRLRAYLPLCTEYFYYVINFLKGTGLIKGKGIAIQGLSSGALHNLAVPLPPLEEQKRIVAKIEELMPFVEQYAKASTRLNALNASFPDQMKKSILQQAVMGKLVPQDPSDEPASVLLKKIAEEQGTLIKSKKLKLTGKINKVSDVDLDIPESWVKVKLKDLIAGKVDNRGKTPEHSKVRTPPYDIDLLEINALIPGKTVTHENVEKFITEKVYQALRGHVRENDILIATVGSLGKFSLMDSSKSGIAQNIIAIRFCKGVNPKYIFYLLQSQYFEVAMASVKMEAVQASIKVPDLFNLMVPLPPEAEQERIVDRIDQILEPITERLCKEMEKMK